MKPLIDIEKFIVANKPVLIRRPGDFRFDVLEIHDLVVVWTISSEYMANITKVGYEFKDEIQLKLLLGLVMNLHNNTWMYENCGHLTLEKRELTESNSKNQTSYTNLFTFDMINLHGVKP